MGQPVLPDATASDHGLLAGVSLPGYLLEEAGIFISAMVWLIIGVVLLVGSVRKPRTAVNSLAE
jgi:hypothetical protein